MNPSATVWIRILYNATFLTLIFILIPEASGSTNFNTCLAEVKSGKWGPVGGTDNGGNPVTNITAATSITYDLCLKACSSAPAPFNWSVFSQQFGSWVLPWLALVSQLPYGTHDARDNLVSMVLTVGSPALAAYSLAFTALNKRWVARRFSGFDTPKARNIARALAGLQQAPIAIAKDEVLLEALVTLRENDQWWIRLETWLWSSRTWTISAGTSVTWVMISYLSTVIESFLGDIATLIPVRAQGIGAAWLWLLPMVIGWLQISPKCDSPFPPTFEELNEKHAYIAQEPGIPVLARSAKPAHRHVEYALSIETGNSSQLDELRTGPIFNYARFLNWTEMVEAVAGMVQIASEKRGLEQEGSEDNRNVSDVNAGVAFKSAPRPRWRSSFRKRFMLASGLALFLQWGTTAGGIIGNWYVLPQGLGCRSGSLFLYGVLSTLVWIMLVLSAFLARFPHSKSRQCTSSHIAHLLSVTLRRVGKIIAFCNALWIVLTCVFQVTGYYDRCYCNSSYLGLRSKAYVVITWSQHDIFTVKVISTIGVFISAGSAFLFWLFIWYSKVHKRRS